MIDDVKAEPPEQDGRKGLYRPHVRTDQSPEPPLQNQTPTEDQTPPLARLGGLLAQDAVDIINRAPKNDPTKYNGVGTLLAEEGLEALTNPKAGRSTTVKLAVALLHKVIDTLTPQTPTADQTPPPPSYTGSITTQEDIDTLVQEMGRDAKPVPEKQARQQWENYMVARMAQTARHPLTAQETQEAKTRAREIMEALADADQARQNLAQEDTPPPNSGPNSGPNNGPQPQVTPRNPTSDETPDGSKGLYRRPQTEEERKEALRRQWHTPDWYTRHPYGDVLLAGPEPERFGPTKTLTPEEQAALPPPDTETLLEQLHETVEVTANGLLKINLPSSGR
jgi:hypothetical protein